MCYAGLGGAEYSIGHISKVTERSFGAVQRHWLNTSLFSVSVASDE